MRQVIQQGVKTKVLMLSATPVNNRFTDLRNQLALAYEGDSEQLASQARHLDEHRGGLPPRPSACSTSGRSCRPSSARPTTILDTPRLRLLRAARRRHDRPLAQAHPGLLRHVRDRRLPRTTAADLGPIAADRSARRAVVQRALRAALVAQPGRLRTAGLRLPEPAREVRGALRQRRRGSTSSAERCRTSVRPAASTASRS